MKRFVLVLLIMVGFLLMAGGALGLYWRLTSATVSVPAAAIPKTAPAGPRTPIISTQTARVAPFAPGAPAGSGLSASRPAQMSAEPTTRKILFAYRNPKAQKVSIRADFNGWKAEPMQKDQRGIWVYQAALTPGEYGYCFTVDDRIVRDPANKRTKQIGETSVSSIVVQPLASGSPH